jgi:hypothetical protein
MLVLPGLDPVAIELHQRRGMSLDGAVTSPGDTVAIRCITASCRAQRFDLARRAASMRRGILSLVLLANVASGGRVDAQVLTSVASAGLRIEWSVDPAGGQWRALCGYIYNDTPVAPREVRLLVEEWDTSERLIGSRIVPVLGYIAPGGRTYFCSTATAAAARYSITIVEPPGMGER